MSLPSPTNVKHDARAKQQREANQKEETWPGFAQKWIDCLDVSRSLSSKKVLDGWQGPTTKKLEDWGRRVHAHDRNRVWDVESRLQRDPDVYQLLNELFDVLIRHFNGASPCLLIANMLLTIRLALGECPSTVASAAPSISNLRASVNTGERNSQPRNRTRRRKPHSTGHASITGSDDCPRCTQRKRGLLRKDTSDMAGSVSDTSQRLLEPSLKYTRSESHWSEETGHSSSVGPGRRPDFKVTAIDESKSTVDIFITQLFDFAETLDLTPIATIPKDAGLGKPGSTQYRDGSYRQAHKTAMDMAPYAEKYVLDRISRAASMRLRELTEAKYELGSALRNSTYYPGRYTHDNPGMVEELLRRVSSLPPPSVLSGQGIESGRSGNGGRRHSSFPLSDRATRYERVEPQFRDDLVVGFGAAFVPQLSQSPEISYDDHPSPSWAQANEKKPPDVARPTRSTDNTHLYVCFVEACPKPYETYDSRLSWGSHIRTLHPEAISPQKASTSTCVWVCSAWSHASEPGGYPSFDDEDLFKKHMYDLHVEAFFGDREFLAIITQACFQQRQPSQPPPRPICPLCRLDYDEILKIRQSEDEDDENTNATATDRGPTAFLDHVADHYDRINRRIMSSVPPLGAASSVARGWQPNIQEPSRGSSASDLESNVWVRGNVGGFAIPPKFKADLEDFGSEAGTAA